MTEDKRDPLDAKWQRRIEEAEKRFRHWWDQADKIYQRYESERGEERRVKGKRFSLLWSNTRVMQGAIYSQRPKPYVTRRQKNDPVSRVAAQVLERALEPCVELSCYDEAIVNARDDRLLSGRGVAWVCYEADYTEEEVIGERCYVDFVLYKDFLHGEAPNWDAVPWVAKRGFMSKQDLVKRFGNMGAQVEIYREDEAGRGRNKGKDRNYEGFAPVWEIWDKRENRVIWYAPDGREKKVLEAKEPPYKLLSFYPCPRPVYATLAPGSLVPVPDYVQYQDQADEVDSLTDRINESTSSA